MKEAMPLGLTTSSSSVHRSHGGENASAIELVPPNMFCRSQALSADNFQGEHHMSMIRPHKHGLEHRSAPPRSQGSHSNTYASFIPMPANILDLSDIEGFPGLDTNFNLFTDDEPTPTDIMVSADNSTTNAGLSAVNDNLFGLPSHLTVPFGAFLRLPLTAPHEACYSQQPPPPPVKQVAGGSVSKDSDSIAAVWSCYYQHFKHNQPFLRRLDQKFRKKVGSLKTVQASLDKRKDEGHWVCPLGCSDFTRKQNLKRRLLFLLTHFASTNRSPDHLQSHLGIKDFDCNCGAQFNALSGLKRHKKKCRTSQLSVTN